MNGTQYQVKPIQIIDTLGRNFVNFLTTEWNGYPILITVETTDYPVENITFPTVTVCREDNEPNCFNFVTKIFDYLPFPCFDNG